MIGEFQGLAPKEDYILKALQYDLPTEYQLQYMIYKVAESVQDELILWDMPYVDVIRRLMFKQFDSYVMDEYKEANGKTTNN